MATQRPPRHWSNPGAALTSANSRLPGPSPQARARSGEPAGPLLTGPPSPLTLGASRRSHPGRQIPETWYPAGGLRRLPVDVQVGPNRFDKRCQSSTRDDLCAVSAFGLHTVGRSSAALTGLYSASEFLSAGDLPPRQRAVF